ncbi:hypothetical protein ARMGADRAFT_1161603 [Armillaria gallica]|uniref:Uncharacterized protein n=1 Tax=Armillaria gallica TaxID=47427 RepID=A0A2H3E2W2_ARMGA|nr:hypothetical protein ARMGADRAFT_1161603 [Armillaria gallica]
MSVPRTMAEELAPIIGQIEALDTFLKCEKEEEDAILADKDRLERELYAYGRASDALFALLLLDEHSKKPAVLTESFDGSTTNKFKYAFSKKRKMHEYEQLSGEASTSNGKLVAPKEQLTLEVTRRKSLRRKVTS